MKKKPKERDWYLDSGFELRKNGEHWDIYEGGQLICKGYFTLETAQFKARMMRKSRNEQA